MSNNKQGITNYIEYDQKENARYYAENGKGRFLVDTMQAAYNMANRNILQQQQIIDAVKRGEKPVDVSVEDFLNEEYQNESSKEYLVDGAMLTCTNCTKSDVFIQDKDVVYHCIAAQEEDIDATLLDNWDDDKIVGKLIVSENFSANIDGLMQATVADSIGKDRNIHGDNYNIPFFGNCKRKPDSELELERFRAAEKENNAGFVKKCGGSCRHLMKLEEEWENCNLVHNYQTFNDDRKGNLAGITMTSFLFCKHGGFIYTITSGQISNVVTEEDILTDLEKELLNKFYQEFAYENWSDEQKRCAEEIWTMYLNYESNMEYQIDANFAVGLIGNMFGEASCGLLQFKNEGEGWDLYSSICQGGSVITNISQAEDACVKAPNGYGIGMMQWSESGRKALLYDNYVAQTVDGTLSTEQLINAEIKTIYDELNGSYNYVCKDYYESYNDNNSIGSTITLSTCVIFREYEAPATYADVSADNFAVVEGVWDKAESATEFKDIPSVCKRIIAAKVVYIELMENGRIP